MFYIHINNAFKIISISLHNFTPDNELLILMCAVEHHLVMNCRLVKGITQQ